MDLPDPSTSKFPATSATRRFEGGWLVEDGLVVLRVSAFGVEV